MKELENKVAVVTGASKGIGVGIAQTLAAAGAAVVVNYSSDKSGADNVVKEIEATGGRALAVQGSVAKSDDVKRLFAETVKAFGRLDILVNNAGVFKFAPLEELQETEFHRHFDTNVLGTLLMSREALQFFGPEGGNIINISSIASTGRMPNMAIYASTKAAVDSITRVLAAELAPRKIRVNTVAPGTTQSEGIAAHGYTGEKLEQVARDIPLSRVGQPADIGQAVLFLVSEASSWTTGERLQVSGGQSF